MKAVKAALRHLLKFTGRLSRRQLRRKYSEAIHPAEKVGVEEALRIAAIPINVKEDP